MRAGQFIEFHSDNPYCNLALEEYLVRWCEEEQVPVLCLWQNKDTIVVGRNQNVYTECNLNFAEKSNILIARRMTGGGAVFHDLGNLNYSIILPSFLYDRRRSTELIVSSLRYLGVDVFQTGRNDICTNQGKISGNAYYSNDKASLHHGTILYDVDLERMESALSGSKSKIIKRGVRSVKSRVSSIAYEHPNISIFDITAAIKRTFNEMYGMEDYNEGSIDLEKLSRLEKNYASDGWIFGRIKDYELNVNGIFEDAAINLSALFQGEKLSRIEISTDSINYDEIENFKDDFNLYLAANNVNALSDIDDFFVNGEEKPLTDFMHALMNDLYKNIRE